MPLVKRITLALGMFAFIMAWNDFLNPLLYLTNEMLFTAPIGLRMLAALDPSDYPIFLAGALIVSLPVIAVFLLLDTYLFRNLDY